MKRSIALFSILVVILFGVLVAARPVAAQQPFGLPVPPERLPKQPAPDPAYFEPPFITPQTSTARIQRRPEDERLQERPTHFSYYRRHESLEGDYKVVTVPAISRRQAKIDAQTYHRGWDATDVWMGQSRVMYNVLLKKRAPYVPGTPPVPRPIPNDRR